MTGEKILFFKIQGKNCLFLTGNVEDGRPVASLVLEAPDPTLVLSGVVSVTFPPQQKVSRQWDVSVEGGREKGQLYIDSQSFRMTLHDLTDVGVCVSDLLTSSLSSSLPK